VAQDSGVLKNRLRGMGGAKQWIFIENNSKTLFLRRRAAAKHRVAVVHRVGKPYPILSGIIHRDARGQVSRCFPFTNTVGASKIARHARKRFVLAGRRFFVGKSTRSDDGISVYDVHERSNGFYSRREKTRFTPARV